LQWIWQGFGFLPVQLLHQAVVNSPCQSSRKAPRQRGVSGFSTSQSFAMIWDRHKCRGDPLLAVDGS
jgi:hypothetical protein